MGYVMFKDHCGLWLICIHLRLRKSLEPMIYQLQIAWFQLPVHIIFTWGYQVFKSIVKNIQCVHPVETICRWYQIKRNRRIVLAIVNESLTTNVVLKEIIRCQTTAIFYDAIDACKYWNIELEISWLSIIILCAHVSIFSEWASTLQIIFQWKLANYSRAYVTNTNLFLWASITVWQSRVQK